ATLTGLMGSAREANKVTGFIKNLETPIDSRPLLKFSETLGYLGLNGDDANKAIERFNISAVATGEGARGIESAADGLTRLVNQGRPTAEVLEQISNSGMPVWSMLADKYGVDIPKVRKMVTDGVVSVDDVMGTLATG